MALNDLKHANFINTSLAANVLPAATTFSVATSQGWPTLGTGDYFYLTLISQTNTTQREIVKVTSWAGDVVAVCVRGQNGTSAQSFLTGDGVQLRWNDANIEDLKDEVNTWLHPATGAVGRAVVTDDARSGATPPYQTGKLAEILCVDDFGAYGDGTTNDASFIQSALNAAGVIATNKRGAIVTLGPNKKYYCGSTTLTVPSGVTLQGRLPSMGSPFDNTNGVAVAEYFRMGSCLIQATAATNALVRLWSSASIQDVMLAKEDVMAGAINVNSFVYSGGAYRTFAGTAIQAGINSVGSAGYDTAARRCFILGFETAINASQADRFIAEDIKGDCWNGILVQQCADVVHISKCHFWPWMAIGGNGAAVPQIWERGGVGFKMQFDTFAGADWAKISDCFAFGFVTNYSISTCDNVTLLNCSADNYYLNTGNTGFSIAASANSTPKLLGCSAAGFTNGYGFDIANSAGHLTLVSDCSMKNCAVGIRVNGAGDVTILGCQFMEDSALAPMDWAVEVANATSQVLIDACAFSDTITALDCVKITAGGGSANVHVGQNLYNLPIGGSAVVSGTENLPAIASAATINPAYSQDLFTVTGTTTIETIGVGWKDRRITLRFESALTIRNRSGLYTTAPYLGGEDIVVRANDCLTFICLTAPNDWYLIRNDNQQLHFVYSAGVAVGAKLDGTLAVGGGTPDNTKGVSVTSTNTIFAGATGYYTYRGNVTFPASATNLGVGYGSVLASAAAAFTVDTLVHFIAEGTNKGAGSTITNVFGFFCDSTVDPGGTTIAFGYYSELADGTNKWNFYSSGSAPSYLAAALIRNVNNYTANQTLNITHHFVTVDATGGNVTLTLPAANIRSQSMPLIVKRIDSSGNTVTVQRAGADTIEVADTSFTIAALGAIHLQSDGSSHWWKVASF